MLTTLLRAHRRQDQCQRSRSHPRTRSAVAALVRHRVSRCELGRSAGTAAKRTWNPTGALYKSQKTSKTQIEKLLQFVDLYDRPQKARWQKFLPAGMKAPSRDRAGGLLASPQPSSSSTNRRLASIRQTPQPDVGVSARDEQDRRHPTCSSPQHYMERRPTATPSAIAIIDHGKIRRHGRPRAEVKREPEKGRNARKTHSLALHRANSIREERRLLQRPHAHPLMGAAWQNRRTPDDHDLYIHVVAPKCLRYISAHRRGIVAALAQPLLYMAGVRLRLFGRIYRDGPAQAGQFTLGPSWRRAFSGMSILFTSIFSGMELIWVGPSISVS